MRRSSQLLLGGVVAVVLAFAIPATAFGSVWTHEGSELSEAVTIEMAAAEVFETAPTGETKNGMICPVHAELELEPESEEGLITAFETETSECEGFGSFAGCEVTTADAPGLSWTIEANASDLTVFNWHTKRAFTGSGCPGELDKTIEELTLTPDDTEAMKTLSWHSATGEYTTFGTFQIEGAASGTYGFE
jgi:hypothetical protein